MRTHPQLVAGKNKIIHFLNNSPSPAQIRQVQAQLILCNLHSNSTIALHFITACQRQRLSLFRYCLPLFLNNKPHVFTCNNLIRAFSGDRAPQVSFFIYTHMLEHSIQPNNFTFPFLLKNLSDFKELKQGQCVHTHVLKLGLVSDIYVQNSLVNLYASCGHMRLCRKLFDEMPEKDVVSWTALIMGYRNVRMYDEALLSFELMQYAGVVPNRVTMVNVLGACASLGAVEMGVWIHDFIRRSGWELDVVLGTCLIDMYAKCLRMNEGLSVFQSMKGTNVFTWNTVIKGLACVNRIPEAVWWFNRMEEEGFRADELTLVNLLSACSHSGLVDIGREIFSSIVNGKYYFSPSIKHYACMIDLLARSGCLDEAFKCITQMPFEPTKSMWVSLLGACRDNGNLELSDIVTKKLIELEPQNGAYYVALSSLYAQMGRWSDCENVRKLMKERGIKEGTACSSV